MVPMNPTFQWRHVLVRNLCSGAWLNSQELAFSCKSSRAFGWPVLTCMGPLRRLLLHWSMGRPFSKSPPSPCSCWSSSYDVPTPGMGKGRRTHFCRVIYLFKQLTHEFTRFLPTSHSQGLVMAIISCKKKIPQTWEMEYVFYLGVLLCWLNSDTVPKSEGTIVID